MKASMILLFTMVAVLMGSVTPAEAADLRAEGSKPSRIVHSADSGKQISIREGEILEIRLEQAGATGYSWEIIEMDERRLKVLSSDLVPIREGIVLGGPVVMTWRLKALKKGRTELKASLYRSWEGLGKAARHFSLKIDIN